MKKKSVIRSGFKFLVISIIFILGLSTALSIAQVNLRLEEQRKTEIAKAQKVLDGTTWTVYTTLQGTRKTEKGTEVFTFTKRRVTTENLAKLGYGVNGSNYSVRYESDGTLVWETMVKDDERKGEVLLRGDLRGGMMTGVIDMKPASGARKIYYFTSSTDKPKAATATSTITPTTKTTTTKVKKPETKKRGWGW